jgi:osmoprotectant transport system permease protein
LKRLLLLLVLLMGSAWAEPPQRITVGSKLFPESWILGEALVQLGREAGAEMVHRKNLGATQIIYEALKQGDIDVYPEYTGTIAEVLLKDKPRASTADMASALASEGIGISYPLGFNDGYGLAVTASTAALLKLSKISDLGHHPGLKLGLTSEFVGRADGWKALQKHYGQSLRNLVEVQHELAYTAIESGRIDVMDVFTTDAQIERLKLVVLEDDRKFFPRYDAVLLYRADLPRRAPLAWAEMQRLVGRIDETQMIRANALVAIKNIPETQAADTLLRHVLPSSGTLKLPLPGPGWWGGVAANTLRHLQLVATSLTVAILVGIPLGVLATRSRMIGAVTLTGAGLMQTIPSLALLAFLVPWLGIGAPPALIALFLYSLLPIVRNTYTGLTTIPANLAEAAEALGLSPAAQLWRVRLPMASPAIMAGIKTSAVINVGTATLAALIGAGGLGEPILQGIALVDRNLIFQGALPAAALALVVQFGFDLLERVVVPRGLRL